MATSSAVASGDLATAAHYNELRTDVRSTHTHDGTEGNSSLGGTAGLAVVKLQNNVYLTGRNNAGSGDVNMMKVNASDQVEMASGLVLASVDINSGAIDGTTIGANTPAPGTFTTIAGTAFSVSTAGLMFINQATNSKMTIGLTINMGANDNDIITLKSSDVTHSMTSLTETDTFGVLKKARSGSGGLFVQAYKDADEGAGDCLILMGVLGEAADTTNTSSSVAVIELDARIKSGSSSGSVAATGNVLAIMNNGVTLQLWEGDGDVHTATVDATNSNSVAAAALDDWDDAGLVRTLTALTQRDLIKNKWDELLRYNEKSLIEAGIIGKAGLANGALLNQTQLLRLYAGAIWQQSSAIRDLQEEITELRTIALGAG